MKPKRFIDIDFEEEEKRKEIKNKDFPRIIIKTETEWIETENEDGTFTKELKETKTNITEKLNESYAVFKQLNENNLEKILKEIEKTIKEH